MLRADAASAEMLRMMMLNSEEEARLTKEDFIEDDGVWVNLVMCVEHLLPDELIQRWNSREIRCMVLALSQHIETYLLVRRRERILGISSPVTFSLPLVINPSLPLTSSSAALSAPRLSAASSSSVPSSLPSSTAVVLATEPALPSACSAASSSVVIDVLEDRLPFPSTAPVVSLSARSLFSDKLCADILQRDNRLAKTRFRLVPARGISEDFFWDEYCSVLLQRLLQYVSS